MVAPLDTACTHYTRNLSTEFIDIVDDNMKVFFGSQMFMAKSKDTYDIVPGILYVLPMIITALRSVWQLLGK